MVEGKLNTIERELYEIPFLNGAHVGIQYTPEDSCGLNRKIAEAQGFIGNYEKYGKCFDGIEPTYMNNPDLLGSYCKPVAKKVRDFYGEKLNVAPYQKDLKVKIGKLPTKYRVLWKINEDGIGTYIFPVGKTFGMLNPQTGEATIDPVVFPELGDPERKYLSGIRIPTPERVIGEEILHHGQAKLGILDNYIKKFGTKAKDYIEGQASTYADQLFGKTGVYPSEKAEYVKLMDKYGEKKALTGCLNCFCAA